MNALESYLHNIEIGVKDLQTRLALLEKKVDGLRKFVFATAPKRAKNG